ncbi:MAG: NfeD family protein [Spirochaetales bacterium]|nr:NfeD family protein [Spirochaetales bacterium]
MSDMNIEAYISWIWVGIFVVLVVIEAATQGLTTIWGAASALIMVFISRTGMNIGWQILLFLVMTLGFVVTTRPVLVKKLKVGNNRTNVDTMIGEEVIVTKAISTFEKGEARSKNGVIWSVTSTDGTEIGEGAVCTVQSVEGNTLRIAVKA